MFLVKSINETLQIIKENFKNYRPEKRMIKVEDSLNFVTSSDVFSHEDVPHFNRSIVDGYAVDFRSVQLASYSTPAILKLQGEVLMGEKSLYETSKIGTIYVPTGGHLPNNANSVVMIENTEKINDEIFVYKSTSMWENVLLKGSDIKKNSILVKKNTTITPLVIGALKSVGIKEIEVYEKLSATIISTGDEIVDDKDDLEIGEIRDINTYTIKNYLILKNFVVDNSSIIIDDFDKYMNSIITGFKDSDIVITSGGSSVGEKDYTYDVLQKMGAEILVHGVNIKPGKPTIIAKYKNKMFFGLPGQPTSAYFVLNTFLNQIKRTMYNLSKIDYKPYIEATVDMNIHSVTGRRMYQLVKLSKNENNFIATPLFAKSGMIHSLQNADGYIIIDEYKEGITVNEKVKVYRLED